AVADGESFLRAHEPADRGVPVDVSACARRERVDDVLRRAELRVSPAEVDERRASPRGRLGDPAEKGDEVLLGEPLEALGSCLHLGHSKGVAGLKVPGVNLVDALSVGVGPRVAGSDEASRAADVVADAFRALGLTPRFQEFELLAYEADEPELVVDGERWPAGPCMYAHPFDGAGTVRRIGSSPAPVGDGRLPSFALVDGSGREVARLMTSPFSTGAIPFMSPHTHVTTPPTAFVSAADAARLEDGMHVRLRVGGRFLPGRRERNVIVDIPGRGDGLVVAGAHV